MTPQVGGARPLTVVWVGEDDGTPAGRVRRRCRHALARRPDVCLVETGPADVVIVADGSEPEVPAHRYLHLPLDGDYQPHMVPALGLKPGHRAGMPPNTPYVPLPDADGSADAWEIWADGVVSALHELVAEPHRIRLSVVVVADGDPDALRRTLAGMRGLADELVVVHGGPDGAASRRLAEGFGARYEPVEPWSPPAARQAAGLVAAGQWILRMQAGERLAFGHVTLRRIVQVPPQGQDVCLVDLLDGRALELGQIPAPRLIANRTGLTWHAAMSEGLAGFPSGAVVVSQVGITGVAVPDRPELRAAAVAALQAMLHQCLTAVPEHPQINRLLGDQYRTHHAPHAASRHYGVTMAFHGAQGTWPVYVAEAAEARIRIAWELGHLTLVEDLLTRHARSLERWAPFWLFRALMDRRAGRVAEAAGAVGRGWEFAQEERFADSRPALALLAAAVCADTDRYETCAAWLAEAVRALPPASRAGAAWITWLAETGHPLAAQQLAGGLGLPYPTGVPAQTPPWPEPPPATPTLSVCLVVDGDRPPVRQCLTMASRMADELIVLAPAGSEALGVAAGYAAKCVAVAGDLDPVAAQAATLASGDWLLVLNAHEWPDVDGMARLRGWLSGNPADQAVRCDVHPVIEEAAPDLGETAVTVMAPRRAVSGLQRTAGGWRLMSDLPATEIDGLLLWREGMTQRQAPGLDDAAAALQARRPDVAEATLEAVINRDRERVLPAPWLWQAWEYLADAHRLQGRTDLAMACLQQVAACRPVLSRPGVAAAVRTGGALPVGGDDAGMELAVEIVQAVVMGRLRTAVLLAEQAVQAFPQDASFWGLLAQVRLEASDLAGCEAAARRCLLLRTRMAAAPVWFPDLGTMPEGWLGRIWLASGDADRALDWLVPQLNRPVAQVDWVIFALAAAWQSGAMPVLRHLVAWLLEQVAPDERAEVDAVLAAAASEYGWPADSLGAWRAWADAARP